MATRTQDPLAALGAGSAAGRRRAAEALALAPRPEALGPLIVALDDGNATVRAAAARALAALGDPCAEKPLALRLGVEGNQDTRRDLGEALVRLGGPSTSAHLFAVVIANPKALDALLPCVATLGASALPEALRWLLAARTKASREAALRAVAAVADAAAEAQLLAHLRAGRSDSERRACIHGLLRCGTPAALGALGGVLDDPRLGKDLARELAEHPSTSTEAARVALGLGIEAQLHALALLSRRAPDDACFEALRAVAEGVAAALPTDSRYVDAWRLQWGLARVLPTLGDRARALATGLLPGALEACSRASCAAPTLSLVGALGAALAPAWDPPLAAFFIAQRGSSEASTGDRAVAESALATVTARLLAAGDSASEASAQEGVLALAEAFGAGARSGRDALWTLAFGAGARTLREALARLPARTHGPFLAQAPRLLQAMAHRGASDEFPRADALVDLCLLGGAPDPGLFEALGDALCGEDFILADALARALPRLDEQAIPLWRRALRDPKGPTLDLVRGPAAHYGPVAAALADDLAAAARRRGLTGA
ncbi:MAG: HEAT repeat domain-containing protein [Deltaproteobacteria bacterium]|nr:HEAT repeat domain-containing protein [Deltaproteobacteria bacterium]